MSFNPLQFYEFGKNRLPLVAFETVLSSTNYTPNAGDSFVLSVTATRAIDYVEFYDGITLLATVSASPFQFNVNTIIGGTHFYESKSYSLLAELDTQNLSIDTEQMIRFPQEFNNPYWIGTVPTGYYNDGRILANQSIAPNGTLTADLLYDNDDFIDGASFIYENESNIIASQQYAFSIYAKAGVSGFLQLSAREASFGLNVWANFDLVNGTVTAQGTFTIAKIQYDNSGWYRCVMVGISTASINIGAFVVGIVELGTSLRQKKSLNDNEFYIWGAKLQKGNVATAYTDTQTGIQYSGATPIICEATTNPNLITQPETFENAYWLKDGAGYKAIITSNTVNDIYGNLTADTMAEPLTVGSVFMFEGAVSIINATSYVFSIYAKAGTATAIQLLGRSASFGTAKYANFNLSTGVVGVKGATCTSGIVDVGGGWYRCWMSTASTGTATGGFTVGLINNDVNAVRGLSYTGTGKSLTIWGAKFEVGGALTDYIPQSQPLVSFGFGSDLHYGTINNYAGRYPQDGDNKLTDAVTFWNTQSLDFAFMNGDYTDNGHIAYTPETDHATALVNLDYIETIFDDFIGQRYYSLGNHDTDKMSKAEFFAHTPATSKYYYFDVNGVRFIVLDATYLSDNDTADFDTGNQDPDNHLTDWIPPTERTWLDATLSSATGKCIILVHQSLHSDSDPLSINNASVVRTIIETYGNVLAVISGHEHINLKTTINGIPYYSMNAMTSGAYPANAYAVIKILADNTVKIIGYGSQTSYN